MTGVLNPQIEILFQESSIQTVRDRFDLPLFFIVGGVDDAYLAQLLGLPVENLIPLILNRSVDPIPSTLLMVVYASRSSLNETWARTFPLSLLAQERWPILTDLSNPGSKSVRRPTTIEQTWILRALDRCITSGKYDLRSLYDVIRNRMLRSLYSETLSLSIRWDQIDNNTDLQELLQRVLRKLSEEQLDYPLYILVDDLPIQYNLTFREVAKQLQAGPCSSADLRAIRTSVELISL